MAHFLLAIAYFVLSIWHPGAWAGDIPPLVSYVSSGFPHSSAEVPLFANGNWTGAIFYPDEATPETRISADTLRTYLLKLGGTRIDVVPYDPSKASAPGIRVGLASEWFAQTAEAYLDPNKYDYAIISEGASLKIHGRTSEDLRQAVWRFMEILGYRQFFPTPSWEYVPIANDFSVKLGIGEIKNLVREQLLGGLNSADLDENGIALNDWRAKNRLDMGEPIQEYQMWYKLVQPPSIYAAEFASNPALASPTGNKLCVLEPRVIDIMYEYLGTQIDAHPDHLTYSVSAGDSPEGWDSPCSVAESSMNPSQRQLYLANAIQARFNEEPPTSKYYKKNVAFLAYGRLSSNPYPCPTKPAPGMAVAVASNFIEGGYTAAQVAQNYLNCFPLGEKSQTKPQGFLGYYDYLGTHYYAQSVPTQGKIGNQSKWSETFRQTYAVLNLLAPGMGKYLTGESGNSFGAFGAGYYTMAKLFTPPYTSTTDPNIEIPIIMRDFVGKAFGIGPNASMTDYFNLVTAVDGQAKIMSSDLLHRMYDFLKSARSVAENTHKEKDRINDLVTYTRALDLAYHINDLAVGTAARGDALYTLSQFIYRMRNSFMYDFFSFFSDKVFPDLATELQKRCPFFGSSGVLNAKTIVNWAPECIPAWSSSPFADDEIETIVTNGLTTNPLFDFTPIFYPMSDLSITTAFDYDTRGRVAEAGGQDGMRSAPGSHDWILKTNSTQTLFSMRLKAVCSATHCESYAVTAELNETNLETGANIIIDSFTVPADNIEVSHSFSVQPGRIYRLKILNTTAQVTPQLGWDKTLNKIVLIPQQGESWHQPSAAYTYFYIPKSIDTLVVYMGLANSKIYDPNDLPIYTEEKGRNYAKISVPETDRGKIWKMFCQGTGQSANGCYLLNVPAQVARSPQELLIQQSLIDRDGLH